MTELDEYIKARQAAQATATPALPSPTATSTPPIAAAAAMGGDEAAGRAALQQRLGASATPAAAPDDRSWWQRHITGEGGYEPDIQELGAAKIPPGTGWQAYTLPLTTSDPKARADILEKHIKDARQSTDRYGNPVIELPGQGPDGKETKKFYLNRPGVSEADIQGFVGDVATSLPAARAFAGIRGVGGALLRGLGQMGTQAAREGAARGTGAETPFSQAAINTGLAGAGSLGGEVIGKGITKLAQAVTPTVDDAAVSAAFGKADLDWANLPAASRQQIFDRLSSFTPSQAKSVLGSPENVKNLYRSSLQTEFGDLSRGQIAQDVKQIGREARGGLLPAKQTAELVPLLERQSSYFKDKLLDLEGKSVANLEPASISSRLNMILKDPEALSLFEPGVLAEIKRGKDFADLLRKKGTASGDIAYKLLQQLAGRIPSLAVSMGAGALGLKYGGLYHAATALAPGYGLPSIPKKVVDLYRASAAASPPPLAPGPISPLGLSGGLLGSNLAVQGRGMGLLDGR